MSVAVLGHRGMLGATVARRFAELGADVATTDYRYPDDPLVRWAAGHEFVVNCILYRGDSVAQHALVNAILPHELARVGCRLVQPSTDAAPEESDYARTKRMAEFTARPAVILRCSIVGQRPMGRGYSDWTWNGVSTLTWANIAHDLLRADPSRLYIPTSPPISRAELSRVQAEVFGWPPPDVVDSGRPRDRVQMPLHPWELEIPTPPIRRQLEELRDWLAAA